MRAPSPPGEAPFVVRVVRLHPERDGDLPLPRYMTPGSAGMDVVSAEDVRLEPLDRKVVPTGLALAVPEGHEIQVRPRSGLALRHGITLPNSPGTIDSDYRGELGVLLINLSRDAYDIRRGDRIAQLVVARVQQPALVLVESLDATGRASGGFGHTGK